MGESGVAMATSTLRTAYPSTAVLAKGGTSSREITSAANTQPISESGKRPGRAEATTAPIASHDPITCARASSIGVNPPGMPMTVPPRWHTRGVEPTAYAHLPLRGFSARWTGRVDDLDVFEELTMSFENEAWTVDGRVSAPSTQHGDVQYVMRFTATWHLQQMLLFRDMDEPDLWLANDGRGRWGEVNGSQRRDLGGCDDVDVRCSPFTRAMGIRRLGLAVGASTIVHSVVVDPETLEIGRARLDYTRLATHRWAIHRDDDLPVHEFDVDEFGLPLDIDGWFTRVE